MIEQNPLITKADLKSPAVIVFGAVYCFALVLVLLSNPVQALIYLGMSLGILFLVWLILDLTRKFPVAEPQVKKPWLELALAVLFFLIFEFTPYLYLGDKWSLGEIVKKEVIYVVLPLVLLRLCGNSFSSMGFSRSNWKQNLKLAGIVIACLAVPCLFMIGNTGKLLLGGQVSLLQALPAFFLYFLHNIARSGFPEEFFYRAFLQTRVSFLLKSRLGGILLVSILFGLVHIPNYPDLPLSEAFVSAFFLQGFLGLLYGVIWDRTRNLLPGVLVHSGINALNSVGDAISMFFQ